MITEPMDLYDWEQVHAQIVRETWASLDVERAAALVGILSSCEIRYSDALRAVVEPVEGGAPAAAPVLTPAYAASLVGGIFGMAPDDLLGRHRRTWRRLRSSPTTRILIADLEEHRFVGRVIAISDLP